MILNICIALAVLDFFKLVHWGNQNGLKTWWGGGVRLFLSLCHGFNPDYSPHVLFLMGEKSSLLFNVSFFPFKRSCQRGPQLRVEPWWGTAFLCPSHGLSLFHFPMHKCIGLLLLGCNKSWIFIWSGCWQIYFRYLGQNNSMGRNEASVPYWEIQQPIVLTIPCGINSGIW